MNEKVKKKLTAIAAVILLAVCGVWMLTDGAEHIEDSNGAENYSLTTITDQDIIEHEMGVIGLNKSTDALHPETVRFSSEKFTGVEIIRKENVMFTTGYPVDVLDFEVRSGNFRMVVVNNGKIIADLTPEDSFPVDLGTVNGNVMLVIAGESADFSFRMWERDVTP